MYNQVFKTPVALCYSFVTVEQTDAIDKSNSVTSAVGGNSIDPPAGESTASEGKSAVGNESEILDDNEANKKLVTSEALKNVSGTENTSVI